MKIVVFNKQRRLGVLKDSQVIDLNLADPRLPSTLIEFIEGGDEALDRARRLIESPPAKSIFRVGDVTLQAPWPRKRICMAGGNYAEHLARMDSNMHGKPWTELAVAEARDGARDKGQWGFWKVLDEVTAPMAAVAFPERATYLDYEGEVAIVLAKGAKNIKPSDARGLVWGITLTNDWSIRGDPGTGRNMSFNLAKNFDGSVTVGPCIVVGDHDFEDIDCETRVNGELRQRFNTRDMIFSFGEILEHVSRDFSFVAGDIVSGGTGMGTAADMTKNNPDGSKPMDLFLRRGDVVEVSSPQIGAIRNTLV